MKTTAELRKAIEGKRSAGGGRGRPGYSDGLRTAVVAWSAKMTRDGVSIDHQARAVSLPAETLRRWCAAATVTAMRAGMRPVSVIDGAPMTRDGLRGAGERIEAQGGVVLRIGAVRVEGLGLADLIAVLRGLA